MGFSTKGKRKCKGWEVSENKTLLGTYKPFSKVRTYCGEENSQNKVAQQGQNMKDQSGELPKV